VQDLNPLPKNCYASTAIRLRLHPNRTLPRAKKVIRFAVPGRCGVRQSGLASCRPLPLAPFPAPATGGGRVAPLFGKLFVGGEFLHSVTSLLGGGIVAEKRLVGNGNNLPTQSLTKILIIDLINCFGVHNKGRVIIILSA
jgi:hypothetical protein